MSIYGYEMTDTEWAIIEPLITKHHRGRLQKDIRAHLNGILWIARSGARWEDLSARYGPHQAVYSCFCWWRDDGTLQRIFEAIHAEADLTEWPLLPETYRIAVKPSHRLSNCRSRKGIRFWTTESMARMKNPRLSDQHRRNLHHSVKEKP